MIELLDRLSSFLPTSIFSRQIRRNTYRRRHLTMVRPSFRIVVVASLPVTILVEEGKVCQGRGKGQYPTEREEISKDDGRPLPSAGGTDRCNCSWKHKHRHLRSFSEKHFQLLGWRTYARLFDDCLICEMYVQAKAFRHMHMITVSIQALNLIIFWVYKKIMIFREELRMCVGTCSTLMKWV